jgi:glycosyltransferase involved in cell wall biosynthesis
MAKQLVQRGHEVTLLVVADRRKAGIVASEWDGVRVVETPDLLWGRLRSGWDPWNLVNRRLFLGRENASYDLIHCFETRPVTIYPALFQRKRHPAPLLTDWNDWWGRGGVIDEFRPRWYRSLFGPIETYYEEAFRTRADGLTVISTALRDRAIRMGVPPETICYIPGGVFPEQFPHRTIGECREKVGFPLSDILLGYSSIDSHAEMDTMMRVLSMVAGRFPTVKLLITGKTGRGVVDMAEKHGVAGNLRLTGFLPFEDLSWYLGTVNMFILPFPPKIYNIGRWPNKLGEYMSLGRPTVSNPVGDLQPLFEERKIGLPARWDAGDIAEKVIRLIENPAEAEQLGRNARRLAGTDYDWRILTGTLEEFYHKILKGRSGRSTS